MKNIFDYSREKLEKELLLKDMSAFRSQQIFDWIYKKKVSSFDEMLNIGKSNIAILKEEYSFSMLKTMDVLESKDKTKKFLFELEDGKLIETVLMNFNYGKSVCISTQVGCDMGCSFCASGKDKKERNLSVAEMVLQVFQVNESLQENERLTNIVIMGIGEPFDNYDNLIDFIKIVNDNKGINIGARHITVSTCGLIPQILKFADLPLQINLAISLHFANDEKRSKYMKVNKVYNLKALFKALEVYYAKTKRRITFEYLLIKDVNDTLEDAEELVGLVRNLNSYINLIPYNDTQQFSRSTKETQNIFYDYLMKNKVNVTLRREQGLDISAACGQLRIKKDERGLMEQGLIIKSISGEYTIVKENNDICVCKPRGLFRYQKLTPKVGDIVEFSNDTITNILPRKNELVRPFIANVDKMFLVFSVVEPTFNENLLDRILAINQFRNIESIIVITKLDLFKNNLKYDNIFEYYKKIGYKVYSNVTDLDLIEREISKSIVVFAGQTGVGKTTLLNKITGLNYKTAEISKALGRGKHTTRHTELFKVKDGWLADTPGFGITDFNDMDILTMSHSFKEFFEYSEKCRFSKCKHINEPDCYVKKMVSENKIISSRYENYKLFINEIEETKIKY